MVQSSAVPVSDRSTINAPRIEEASRSLSKLNIDQLKRGTLLLYDNEAKKINWELQQLYEVGSIELKFQFLKVTKCLDTFKTACTTDGSKTPESNDNLPLIAQAMRKLIKAIFEWKSPLERVDDSLGSSGNIEDQIYSFTAWPPTPNHPLYASYSSKISPMPKALSNIALEINSSTTSSNVLSDVFYLLSCDLIFFPVGSPAWLHRHEASTFILEYINQLSEEMDIDIDAYCVVNARKRRKYIKKENTNESWNNNTDHVKKENPQKDDLKTPADTQLLLDLQQLFTQLTIEDHSDLYNEFQNRAEWSFVDQETCELNHQATTQGIVKAMIVWCKNRINNE